jgi:hypothetical protein
MAKGAGSGDILARGGRKATYSTTEGGVKASKWNKAFDDFDYNKFISGSDTNEDENGDASTNSGGSGVFETSRSRR